MTVLEVNRPPTLSALLDRVVAKDSPLTFNVAAIDPDIPSQTLSFTLGPGAPTGAAIDANTGLFTWTPTGNQGPSTNRIAIIVADNGTPSLTATQAFTVTVGEVNLAPILQAITNRTVNEGELLTFTASATDPDLPAQTLTFSLDTNSAPAGASIDPVTGVFTWTPSEFQGPDTHYIRVVVTDNGTPAKYADAGFLVTVQEVNRPPELNPIANQVANVGGLLTFGVTALDLDIPAQNVVFSLGPGAPEGAAIRSDGQFSWTPTPAQAPSTNTLTVIASDGAAQNSTASRSFTVTVTVGGFNRPPTLDLIPDQTVDEGKLLTFTVNAADPEQPFQTLTYALDRGAPVGTSLDPLTGVFTWTPSEFQGPGTNFIRVVVTDNGTPLQSVEGNVRIVVNEVNQPPFFLPDTNHIVNVGTPLIFSVEADDLDIPRTLLTYSLGPGAPGDADILQDNVFSWRPGAGQGPSNYFVSVIVTDGGVPPLKATNVIEINVIVGAPLTPPVLRDPIWGINNVFTTTIDMIAGRRYTLEGTDTPDSPNWPVIEAFQGRGAVDTMTDRNATNRNRLYRARVE